MKCWASVHHVWCWKPSTAVQPVVAMATPIAAQGTRVAVVHHFRHSDVDFAALYSKHTTHVSITHFYSCSFPSLPFASLTRSLPEVCLCMVLTLSLPIHKATTESSFVRSGMISWCDIFVLVRILQLSDAPMSQRDILGTFTIVFKRRKKFQQSHVSHTTFHRDRGQVLLFAHTVKRTRTSFLTLHFLAEFTVILMRTTCL